MYFEYDIFLSYKTSSEDVDRWIGNFKTHVSKVLSQLLNKDVKIISSKEVQSSSDIMSSTGAFVAIVTDEYLSDSIENSYLNEFNKLSKGKRIFKIIKTNIPQDEQPETLRNLAAYDFYHAELADNQKISHDKFFKTEAERLYWLKIVDLAYAIYNSTVSEKDENRIKNIAKSVYIAEVSSDQNKYRDTVMRELQYHGYTVLPQKNLPNNKIDFEQTVAESAESCQLSIHILGEKYGETLPGEAVSKVELQNRIVAEVNKKTGIERFIWVNPELSEFEEKQSIYLESLKKDIEELEGAELIQTPLEIFKTIIINKLSEKSRKKGKNAQDLAAQGKSIYLINGKEDLDRIKDLEKWIEGNGYHVIHSEFEGNRGDIVEKHRNNLAQCDGALIYYAHSNPQWIRMKLQDLVKAPGFGRTKPLEFSAIYNTINEEIPQNNNLSDLLVINQTNSNLNIDGLKELTIKLS